ncbi:hypothetical protein CYMTET_36686 [Cymbomonas tetramitiformis]|uniref:Uncharacterized protein n=1 Tax=Cymbomonas tetramitiformis TaxID=36881 RepID=A0AAE0CFE4_9CHLO|nr:hypothetical protein CYMTET_36686 [Cymbomonas tetramitiformis]
MVVADGGDEPSDSNNKDKGTCESASQAHTADELEKATKRACAEFGIGKFMVPAVDVTPIDTVSEFIHTTCSDNASDIVSGWRCFDGHECSDHTLALVVKVFLEHPTVKAVFSKLRGMAAHFNHSVIGANLLKECQRRHGLSETKPP